MDTFDASSRGIGVGGAGGWGGFGGIAPIGIIGLNSLFNRHGDGGDDDGGSCGRAVFNAGVMSKLGTIEAAIPTVGLGLDKSIGEATASIKDSTQNQTLFLQNQLSQLALGLQQGFGTVKDSVQLSYAGLAAQGCETQNIVREVGCQIKSAIAADGNETRQLINSIRIGQLETELAEQRADHRSRIGGLEITQTVNTNQQQAQFQAQTQSQLNGLFGCFHALAGQIQNSRATAGSVQFGTGNLAANTPTSNANQVG